MDTFGPTCRNTVKSVALQIVCFKIVQIDAIFFIFSYFTLQFGLLYPVKLTLQNALIIFPITISETQNTQSTNEPDVTYVHNPTGCTTSISSSSLEFGSLPCSAQASDPARSDLYFSLALRYASYEQHIYSPFDPSPTVAALS